MKKKQNHPILNEYIEWTKEIHPSGMRWLMIGEEETFSLPGGIEGRWVNLPTFLSAEEEDREPADGIYVAQALNLVNDWEPLCEIFSAQYKECILIFSLDLATREGKALQRPSIYWLSRLSEGGFECLPRFAGGQLYCLASRSANESWKRLQERHRRTLCSICGDVQTNDAELLLAQESVQMEETQARIAFYFANLAFSPKQIQFACTTKTDSHPDLFLDQLKLHYIGSEKTGGNYRHRWEPLLIPTGARRLAIVTADPSAKLESMQIQSAPVSKEAFIKQLPFDHYQRYKFLAEILVRMEEKPTSVLDVGGAYGYFPYFYSSCPAMVVDIVAEEAAYARGYDGQKLPFEDGTFDVVVSIDTVEHLPAGKRESFLRELTRVAEKAVVITGPFQEADVEEAETVLYDFITTQLQSHDRFLEEHRTFSLPKMDEVKPLLSQAGFSLCELPNGYLPRWLGMQLATYALGVTPELAGGRNRLNALYNTHAFESDNKDPSYRRAIIATKDTVSEEQRRRWQSLIQRKNEPDRSLWSIASLIVSLAQYKVLREKDQAIQHYTNRIKDFVDHTQNIEADRKQLQTHADNLNQRISEL
ncbi:methyltransferase domain-containing protein, partial [bacterium]|nr:methyltransferase domain-containing protein [bacterium]